MAGLIPFNRRNDLSTTGFSDLQNMLDDFFTESWPRRSLAGDTFKLDVQDNENEYVVEAELPGIAKEHINLSLNDGKLTISVNKEEVQEDKQKNYIHRERRYSSMARSIFLAEADSDGIKAKLDNGVLNITVPKRKIEDRSKMIEIE